MSETYWAARAANTWKRVRAGLLPRMAAGEHRIEAFMREPQYASSVVRPGEPVPETEAVERILFEYEVCRPDEGEPYWAVSAIGRTRPWLLETGATPPAS